MSNTNLYSLNESTISSTLSELSNLSEEFFDYLDRSVVGEEQDSIWGDRAEDVQLFNALIQLIDAKPFERFIKIRQAGESNKEINKRYVNYLIERTKMSQVFKVITLL